MKNLYYLDSTGEVQGPLALTELEAMHKGGKLTAVTKVCEEGTQRWMAFHELSSFMTSKPTTKKNVLPIEKKPEHEREPSSKRILPAFVLVFLLGAFGVHAFYAGQVFQGVIYILMWIGFVALTGVGSPFAGIPLICIAVFALSDLIRIVVGAYKDGKGQKIEQWT